MRRNAVFAIYTIYKSFEFLIPDGPEVIYNYIQTVRRDGFTAFFDAVLQEMDSACKRAAFIMLCNTDTTRALSFLNTIFGQIGAMDELMQLAVIELIKKDCNTNFAAKACADYCHFY